MTEPRHTADTITDDELDHLYAELGRLSSAFDENVRRHRTALARIDELLGVIARVRSRAEQWQAAMRRGERNPAAQQMLDLLDEQPGRAATDPTEARKSARMYAALYSSAEQTVTRVIALYEQRVKAGPPPLGTRLARWWDAWLAELHDAIHPPTDQTTEHPMDEQQTEHRADIADDVTRHTKELLNRRTETLRKRAEAAEAERDGAYRERAHLVALLAAMTDDAVMTPALDIEEPGWWIAYLTIAGRQCSWHISPRDASLFTHVERVEPDDPRAQWDGHTTDAKYAHIAAWTTELAEQR